MTSGLAGAAVPASAPLRYRHHETPVGQLLLAGDGVALRFISFPAGGKAFGPRPDWIRDDAAFEAATAQLDAYFAGARTAFDLPFVLGGTPFRERVWRALAEIPYGETRSYGWLAARLGAPGASRAVGSANGANPLPILLPCHRVIGATGALTGFGGGIETKRFLLDLEAKNAPRPPAQLRLL